MDEPRKQPNSKNSPFDPIEEIIEAIRNGKMVIVVDDEGRENEGDLICAADKVTPEAINFMASHGKGLICVAMTTENVARRGLARMPSDRHGGGRFGTAFVESVDARDGITTGISAFDRAKTIQLLADPNGRPDQLVKPGHIFPLEAAADGVLARPGHTEAAIDLSRLAGCQPAGVICEVLNQDGSMARLAQLCDFARAYNLKIGSIVDLISYRQRQEKLVHRDHEIQLPTEFGIFHLVSFVTQADPSYHLALVMGEPDQQDNPLVRIHSECLTGDVFGSQRCDCGAQLRMAMQQIAEEGHGAVVYMRQEGRGIGLGPKLHTYELQEKGLDTVEANEKLGFKPDHRDYAVSAQIIKDLGISRMRLLTNNPDKISGLEMHGLIITERVASVAPTNVYNRKYMETKKEKLGHLL